MGIESWVSKVPRASAGPSADPVPAAAATQPAEPVPEPVVEEPVPVQPDVAPMVQQSTPLHRTDAASLEQWLADNRFHTLAAGDNGPLLLVMETAPGSDAADTLLASMLKAISLDMNQQMRLALAVDGSPLQIGAGVRAILVLARLAQPSDIPGIAHLRERLWQHRASGCAVAVTIHPDDLLDNNTAKRPAWEDLKRLKGYLDAQQR
jgi:hypothetical protein